MKEINGIKLSKLRFSLKKMGDFLFHEGPIQSHFINDKNEDFLMFWTDADDQFNRWMLVKSNLKLLQSFFLKTINTRDLILQNPEGFVYLIDIDSEGIWKNISLLPQENIPDDYLPSKDSFFIDDQYEKYALELKAYLAHHFSRSIKFYKTPKTQIAIFKEPPLENLD